MQKLTLPERGVWSEKYGKRWEEAFVVGNGTIGGMLYGQPLQTQMILNAPDFFLKGNQMENLPHMAPYLAEFRKRIQKEGYENAIKWYEEQALKEGYQGLTMSDPIHPLLQIQLEHQNIEMKHGSYRRGTDYANGFVFDLFQNQDGNNIQRKIYVSTANELIIELEGEQPFSTTIAIVDFQQEKLFQELAIKENSWIQTNQYGDGTTYFTSGLIETDGEISNRNNLYEMKQATKIICRISLNEHANTEKKSESLFEESCKKHRNRFEKVQLDLVCSENRLISIDNLLEEMKQTKKIPPVLFEKLYDASRYVMLSCSGKSIPNLQGIWTGTFEPAWSGDYTFDTNVQLAISSFARLGMFAELTAVFKRLEDYFSDFEANAREYYGCQGYMVPAHASTTAKHVHWNHEWPLVTWTGGAAWLAHFYAEYTNYTNDFAFAREKALPFYKKVIQFYDDFKMIDENDKVLFRPSYSPENGMGDNATFDVAALKETLYHAWEIYQKSGKKMPENYQSLLEKLPNYAMNDDGVLKEWIDWHKDENENHRHFSQFYPIFESKEILPETEPILWEAANKAFQRKMEAWVNNEDSGNTSSHGRMHAAMCAISLQKNKALEESMEQFIMNRAFYDSLISAHYNNQNVFNVDANGSIPRIYQDALLYPKAKGKLVVFQSVPYWLSEGKLKGVWLPDAIRVELFEWNRETEEFELHLVTEKETEIVIEVPEKNRSQNKQLCISLQEDKVTMVRYKKGMMEWEHG